MNNNPNRRPAPQRQQPGNSSNKSVPKGSYTSNFTIACVIVIVALALIALKVISMIITDNPDKVLRPKDFVIEEQKKIEEQNQKEKEIEENFVKLSVNLDDTKTGNAILINDDHAYTFETCPKAVKREELVSIAKPDNRDYVVSYNTETMTNDAIFSFAKLATDFKIATGKDDLIIVDSIRTYEDQERILSEKGPMIAAKPGHSEHHSGLALDVSIYQKGNFDGTGDYAWIAENCHNYGYILRYSEDKTEITKTIYEPWHFRYIGIEHATYMKQNNLCLEEYIDVLSKYPIDSARLHVTADDGAEYEIYTVAVSGDAEILVPKDGEYTISGDNNGHIIVSKKLSTGTTAEVEAEVKEDGLTE